MNIQILFVDKTIKIHSVNKNKKIESEKCSIFYPKTQYKIKKNYINFNQNQNINLHILRTYKYEPDILIIDFNDDPIDIYDINSVPVYPIFLNNVFYVTPILLEQLNGFSNKYTKKKNIINDFLGRIYSEIGCIISFSQFNLLKNMTHDHTGIKDFRKTYKILQQSIVNTSSPWMVKHIPQNNFGWLGVDNEFLLRYIFRNYKIENVAELGIYMGKSSKFISNLNPNTNYYGFDYFTNLFLTENISATYEIPDEKFFFKHMRFETFMANMKNHKHLYAIKMNCYDSIQWLKRNNIKVDLFYIDFIKNNNKLIQFIDQIFLNYPNAIILGDDLLWLMPSMKILEIKYKLFACENSYICMKNTDFIDKPKLEEEYKKLLYKLNNDNINDILSYGKKYYNNYLVNMIMKMDKNIKSYVIQMQTDLNHIHDNNNNNIYHFLLKMFKKTENTYFMETYNELCELYPDLNLKNSANIIPVEYLVFNNDFNL